MEKKIEMETTGSDQGSVEVLVEEDIGQGRRFLLGPFTHPITFSGFDLQCSLFAKLKGPLYRVIPQTLMAVVLFIFFLYRVLTVAEEKVEPLSYAWGESNLLAATAMHGFSSAICLGSWTSSDFFPVFFDALKASIPANAIRPSVRTQSMYVKAVIVGVAYILCTIAASVKNIVQGRNSINGSAFENSTFILSDANQYGLEPLISLWMAVCSLLAIAVFILCHRVLAAELKHFNAGLKEAVASGSLHEWLPKNSERHRLLLSTLTMLSARTSAFASWSVFAALLANSSALFLYMSFGKEMSWFSYILTFVWGFVTTWMMMLSLLPAGNLQAAVHETGDILSMNKDHLDLSAEAKEHVAWMLDRLTRTRTQMVLMGAFPVTPTTPHMILFVVPNVSTLLMMMRWLL